MRKRNDELALMRRLSTLVDYDHATGLFTWRERPGRAGTAGAFNAKFAGRVAGTTREDGYVSIGAAYPSGIRGVFAHRLAWYMSHGRLPEGVVDHKNGVRDDNRIENLQDMPRNHNSRNMKLRKDNKSGAHGVYRVGERWRAQARHEGKYVHLGLFDTAEEAARVAIEWRRARGFTDRHLGKKHDA